MKDPQEEFDENKFNENQIDIEKELNSFNYRYGWSSKVPVYDDQADYNTNSKSYYDYLARFWSYVIKWLTYAINRLLRRNVKVKDTESINFLKDGDWIDNGECKPLNYDDIITLYAHVKISKLTEQKTYVSLGNKVYTIYNGSKIKNDGVWSPDYGNVLDGVDSDLNNIKNEINNIKNEIENIKNDIKNLYDIVNKQGEQIQKIINNLYDAGAITNNNSDTYQFYPNTYIANGNINHYNGDFGSPYNIKTSKNGSTPYDTAIGVQSNRLAELEEKQVKLFESLTELEKEE